MKRTQYRAEFKAEAVKQVVKKSHSVVNVANWLGFGEGVYPASYKTTMPPLKA